MTTTRQTGSNYKTKHTQELKIVENISEGNTLSI